jgi:hypothetical protein
MTELYRSGWQLIKVKGVMLMALACCIAFAWWGWDIFRTYGVRPADGGVLAPFMTRFLFGFFLAAFGFAFALGMWFYGTLYAGSIRYDPARDLVHIRTVEFIFTGRDHAFPPSAVDGTQWHEGRGGTDDGVSVHAPWISLRVTGRRWPFIVDAQGHFTNPELGARLFKAD